MKNKDDNNNIIFRASWFKTLDRWSPELVKEFIDTLHNYYNNNEINIKNERVLDMWINAEPLLDGDRERYNKRVETNRENGKNGGAPKGNKNASKSTENNQEQPKTTENNQEQPKTTEGLKKQPKQPIEKEKEKEKEKESEKEKDIDNENETEKEIDIDKIKLKKEDIVSIHYMMDNQNLSYYDAVMMFIQLEKELII